MYVESHDLFSLVGWYDPSSGILEVRERESLESVDHVLRGHFASLSEQTLVFYRDGEKLYVARGRERWVANSSTVKLVSLGVAMKFIVQESEKQIPLEVEYEKPSDEYEWTTPFAEPEDWDFGLFVSNVVNDLDRAARIYRITVS